MKILVAVKRVVDANVKVRVKADKTGVELANVKMSMNPFDEIGVEEAVRLKEAGKATEIVAVSMGPQTCQETLRTALAMGADRAILVQTDAELQPLAVAKLLKAVVEGDGVELQAVGGVVKKGLAVSGWLTVFARHASLQFRVTSQQSVVAIGLSCPRGQHAVANGCRGLSGGCIRQHTNRD